MRCNFSRTGCGVGFFRSVLTLPVLLTGTFGVVIFGAGAPGSVLPAAAERLDDGTEPPAPGQIRNPSQFVATGMLRNQVEFWKLIFTKYGKDQAVFHHRQYPHIVYSVLDFSEYNGSYSGAKLEKLKNQSLTDETDRIRDALKSLADGNTPRNAFERRIERLFSSLDGRKSALYRQAAEEDQIRSQTGIRERFREGLIRSGRYLQTMEKIFRSEGLPPELTRVPLIESSFDYTAYSSVGAAGIWQFMRSTGKKQMRIDSYIDERKDPVLSTRAAAHYLQHAYDVLGSWPLAVTSYNHGITGILRGAKAVGSTDINKIIAEHKAESFGFASKNFYAEFLAAVEVEREKSRYFPGIVVEEPWHFVEIRISRPVGVQDLARIAGTDPDEILRLNTALLSPITNGRIKIPPKFLAKVPPRRTSGGELAQIGEIIHSEQAAEMELTGRKIYGALESDRNRISVDQRVPAEESANDTVKKSYSEKKPAEKRTAEKKTANSKTAAKKPASAPRKSISVSSGDTLSGIAKRTGVKVSKLRQLNPGVEAKIKPGQKIFLE